ncbi:MAG: hypothetical protein RLZZ04_3044 [Cyanobacteriota bacterium]
MEFSKGESSLQIRYLNTDLDLAAAVDLRSLAATFESQGIVPLHVAPIEDDGWRAIFETNKSYPDPESNIAAILSVIEQFEQPELRIWQALTLCEFNIGYDSGSEPWAFNQGLSHELLQRITKAGASLRFTLYPPESERQL